MVYNESMFYENGILVKGGAVDIVTMVVNEQQRVYLSTDTLDEPIGVLDRETPSNTWIELPEAIYIPIVKHLALVNDGLPGGQSAWQTGKAKEIYDTYISAIERNKPKRLRKVVNMEGALKTLEGMTLKFTPPHEFNDIQEGASYILDPSNEYIAPEAALVNDIFIACFAEGPWNNMALSLYGDNGKGVMFVFDCEKLEEDFQSSLIPIKYQFSPPVCFSSEIEQAFTVKHVPWEYEKEWRFILSSEDVNLLKAKKMETCDSFLVPFKKEALYAIYFGPRAKREDIQNILSKVQDKWGEEKQPIIGRIKPRFTCYNDMSLEFL